MRHSRPDGNSIFGSPVYILDSAEHWQVAVKSIQQKWRFISITAEALPNTEPVELSVINAYCLNGPVYIFDLLSVGQVNSKKHIKSILENKEIFKVVFDLQLIGEWLWKGLQCKLVYTIDALIAYNISSSLAMTHRINLGNFCSWIGKVNIPFMQEISQESENPEYWKRRPLIYIMQCYLSGTVSVLMKAWLDIRLTLNDEQVHTVFNTSKEMMAKIAGESTECIPRSSEASFSFTSSLASFALDRVPILYAFEKSVKTPNNS